MPIPDSQITITDLFGEHWRFWAEGPTIYAASDLTPTPWATFTVPALPFSIRVDHDGSLYLSSGKTSVRHHYRNYADADPGQWEEI
jgi:hypothetical protein